MKAKHTIIHPRSRVDMTRLREELCGNPHKLPAGYQVECPMPLYDICGELLGIYSIVVIPSPPMDLRRTRYGRVEKSSAHRIFVRYAGRLVPVGRMNQAKA